MAQSWPLLAGLLALYIPTFFDLANGLWHTEANAHGPIILGLSIWLLARQWQTMLRVSVQHGNKIGGWMMFVLSLMLYIIGRSQGILMFEIGSFVGVLTALISINYGRNALKAQWAPLFIMLFMIPLPSTIVDAFTMPMKMAVSYGVENILFWAGFPISRTGVILQIGQYKLLVADACAGLNTLLTLEAMGVIYLHFVRHESLFRNVVLAILIVPISFIANVLRVMLLVLVTYYFGDAAGQGFLHGFAGMLLFLSALLLTVGTDSVLRIRHARAIHP